MTSAPAPSFTVVKDAPGLALTPAGRRPGADSGDPQVASQATTGGTIGNVGVWECRPGGWPVENRQDTEVAFILAGRATITDTATGAAQEVSAGDLLVLPYGWSGRWDVTETVRKVYAIYTTGAAAGVE